LSDCLLPIFPAIDVVAYLKAKGVKTLYHFTDVKNKDSIIKDGLWSWKAIEDGKAPFKPDTVKFGGSQLSRDLDKRVKMENYVRVSFTKDHPMMYIAMRDERNLKPFIFKVDVSAAALAGALFADRNAAKNGCVVKSTPDHLDLAAALVSDSRTLSDDRKPLFQAEILIPEHVPAKYLS
jgi:hypothetical protein